MHKLLNDSPGEKIMLLGNEAIARGAIEAGVAFATTYPGTPSSEISLNLFQMSQESELYFEYSTNEKVALEVDFSHFPGRLNLAEVQVSEFALIPENSDT